MYGPGAGRALWGRMAGQREELGETQVQVQE